MNSFPVLIRTSSPTGETRFELGHPLIDSYLDFVEARAPHHTLRSSIRASLLAWLNDARDRRASQITR